ncbi:MAG: DsrH/TusB family sulfur metabolism protein [Xanthomonadales bacterium]|nr:DsrH/TusB family sulfur metabolism protein [Xanthomonadales bacterium]
MSAGSPTEQQGCLHLLFSHATDAVQACLSHCLKGDSVVLLNTAVILLLDDAWKEAMVAGVSIHALQAEVLAQGMSELADSSDYQLISDAGWAGLVMRYSHCLSWK